MKFCLAFLASLFAGTVALGATEARDCRVPYFSGRNAPKPPPGCDLPAKAGESGRLKLQNGFVDLGNGTQVRISGRVRIDAGVRR